MALSRLRQNDGTWRAVITQWETQCTELEEDFTDYSANFFSHAEKICGEDPPHKNYGIYGLFNDGECLAVMHINRAGLPGTKGWTLRVLWVVVAPRFDFRDITPKEFAAIASGVINGSLELARSADAQSQHIKIHLGTISDRTYFQGVASGLAISGHFGESGLRGNWLHMEELVQL